MDSNNIPKITTRQTEYLRDQYPSLSYLEAGHISEWLQERKDQLFEQARSVETEADTARLLSLVAAGVGTVCYAVNPFMLLGGMVGGAAWLWFVLQHHGRTKEIAPLPFVRGNFVDAISRVGNYDERSHYQINHLADTIKFLPRLEAEEYTFLYSHFETISNYLTQVEPGKRFYAYRWLLGWFSKLNGRQMPAYESLAQHLEHVSIDSRMKRNEVQAIAELPPTVDIRIFSAPTVDICTSYGQLSPPKELPQQQPQDVVQAPPDTPKRGLLSRSAQRPMDVQVYAPPTSSEFDLADRMGKDATSHLIVGIPGAGKGLLISNALAALKKHHPEITTFYIDPKNDEKETGYFESGVDFLRRINAREMSPSAVIEWFKSVVKEFEAIPSDKLLIFDESVLVTSKFKLGGEIGWMQDKIIGYASASDSIGLRVWIVAQNAHTQDLGLNGGIRSQFVPIALISAKNVAALGALMATQFIPKNQKLSTEEVEEITRQSPVGRAVYFGGENKWFPAKRLPNPSGYDRDTRSFLPGFEPKEAEEPVRDVKALAQREETQDKPPTMSVDIQDDTASLILDWLSKNRPNQWVKFKGKDDRDMSFVNHLSSKSISSEQRDSAITLLVEKQKIDLSPDGCYVKSR
ncbi:hypothetical protein [Brasilonema sp. UFV-L1]|uniref:hypothetical protein n=1 Tax=Brasilonema sp. UFV-L1 TaxID=2234130 RepID=UPI00145E59F7|nr:hypothetical protein [Brasilonema sp. UFV-L1]NMG10352.1 hypothetical protein [Brasilonema sp. UFV-L1]